MENRNNKKAIMVLILGALFTCTSTNAQEEGTEVENVFESRYYIDLNYSPVKKLQFNLSPEIRLKDDLTPDKYLLNFGTKYKPLKYINAEAIYRFGINTRSNKSSEYYHRFAIGLTGKVKFNRFKPTARIRYTNDADDYTLDKQFLRYKASIKYNIPKCKITPFVASEAFQLLDNSSGLYKLRHSSGASYKLKANQIIEASYKFDFYRYEYKNKHILNIGYKLIF